MARWVLGAFLRGGALMGDFPNNYTFVFYFFFFFALERSLNMHGPLESLLAYFKKALINPVYLSLDIMV